jgi:hypothetical protein
MLSDETVMTRANEHAEKLASKLHVFRKTIAPEQKWLREERAEYLTND